MLTKDKQLILRPMQVKKDPIEVKAEPVFPGKSYYSNN